MEQDISMKIYTRICSSLTNIPLKFCQYILALDGPTSMQTECMCFKAFFMLRLQYLCTDCKIFGCNLVQILVHVMCITVSILVRIRQKLELQF